MSLWGWVMAKAKTSVRKGSPKLANIHRSEHRRTRYRANLRVRARRGDEKAARMLDFGKTKAGRNQGQPIS